MSTSVCQGLQSCLEPGFIEPIDKITPPPRSNISQSFPWPKKNPIISQENQTPFPQNKNPFSNKFGFDHEPENQTWNFTKILSSTNTKTEQEQEEKVYVHPLAKRSLSTLSTQSLEMCTEGLGSETGSNNGEFMADLSCGKQNNNQGIQRSRLKKQEQQGNFPPPLTLIGGSDGIQLRPHREGGRLVLKAVTFCRKSCFQAERVGGRLRLFSLSKENQELEHKHQVSPDSYNETELLKTNFTSEERQDSEKEEEDGNIRESVIDFVIRASSGIGATSLHISSLCVENEGLKTDSISDEIQNSEEGGGMGEMEITSEELPRRSSSRCKEEGPTNRGLQISWEPVWMAIS
ncbi:hypothetical protein M9H77_01515 [Catharanthus roseus]|uniref:Uncharacterized protein n=1 Tax=Catharanthus roseus TaxID=4058 RepID=A0ACC0C5P8_CATRO|nr:hypothetical protein M9H77_01515 [Catharanthus roseus]